jgi:hypothetical protein
LFNFGAKVTISRYLGAENGDNKEKNTIFATKTKESKHQWMKPRA